MFLTLFRSRMETYIVIIGGGILMNMLSGAPLGVYIIAYIWIFLLLKNITVYLHLHGSLLFTLFVIIGVMIEQLIFGLFYIIQTSSMNLSLYDLRIIFLQVLIAGVTSPTFFIIFKKIFNNNNFSKRNDERVPRSLLRG